MFPKENKAKTLRLCTCAYVSERMCSPRERLLKFSIINRKFYL